MEIIILLVVVGLISYFAFSSKFSPIPFFPTNAKDLPDIIAALKLQNDQVVYDLGAGTGTVIFAAAQEAYAKGLDTKFVAIDINFILVGIMLIQKFFHPNRANIKVYMGDLFKYPYKEKAAKYKNVSYYMYVSPWFTDPLAELIEKTKRNSHIVAYYYPIKSLKEKTLSHGLHDIFVYEV